MTIMLYGAFTFNARGQEIAYAYSETLKDMEEYVNRAFRKMRKGHVIGIWEMDENGVFDTSQANAKLYKKK